MKYFFTTHYTLCKFCQLTGWALKLELERERKFINTKFQLIFYNCSIAVPFDNLFIYYFFLFNAFSEAR